MCERQPITLESQRMFILADELSHNRTLTEHLGWVIIDENDRLKKLLQDAGINLDEFKAFLNIDDNSNQISGKGMSCNIQRVIELAVNKCKWTGHGYVWPGLLFWALITIENNPIYCYLLSTLGDKLIELKNGIISLEPVPNRKSFYLWQE